MSDGTGWIPPDGRAPAPAATPWSAPAPPSGPPLPPPPAPDPSWSPSAAPPAAPPAAGATPWGSPVPGAPPAAGWAPPPKPGLIPLRPMTLGTILGAMFRVMRRNPLPTFGLALLLSLVGSLLVAGLLGLAFVPLVGSGLATDASTGVQAGLLTVAGVVVAVLAQLLIVSIVQGVVTLEVASGTLGERMRVAGLWRRLRPRLPRLVGWLVLLGIAASAVFVVLVLLITAVASLGDSAVGASIAVGVLGSLGLVVLYAWLSVKLLFVTPAIVLERRGVFASIARSWTLSRGVFWRTFGIILLVLVIYSVASWIIVVPIQLIVSIGGALVGAGTGDEGSAGVLGLVLVGASTVVSWLIGAVGLVMISATVALLHIDTRMRKEGLDQELIRAAEARAAGRPTPDPYVAGGMSPPAPDSPWA